MNCRSCHGQTIPLLDLGKQPLANALLDSPEDSFETYPLVVRLCEDCGLGQLAETVPPEKMFREYDFYSSVSKITVEAARRLVGRIVEGYFGTGGCAERHRDMQIVEIASNDGYLLQFYQQRNLKVLGIDPANGPSNAAEAKGIPVIREFFNLSLVPHLPAADIVHANNVLAHVPDLNDFVAGLAALLKPRGVTYIEVPYLGDLLETCAFDTFYHEHVYYFSCRALEQLFARHGLYITDIEHLDLQGGTYRLRLRKFPNPYFVPPVENLQFKDMQSRARRIAENLRVALALTKRTWGYAACAKATVFMNYAEIDRSLLAAVADDTPAKIMKYIPGTGIPVRSVKEWSVMNPDYTCIFAWNHEQAIREKYSNYSGEFFTSRQPNVKVPNPAMGVFV